MNCDEIEKIVDEINNKFDKIKTGELEDISKFYDTITKTIKEKDPEECLKVFHDYLENPLPVPVWVIVDMCNKKGDKYCVVPVLTKESRKSYWKEKGGKYVTESYFKDKYLYLFR